MYFHQCPKCGSTHTGVKIMWGREYQVCFECKYRQKMKQKEPQYYYERDAVENKMGLIEEMVNHL